jgi:hypothetical protein
MVLSFASCDFFQTYGTYSGLSGKVEERKEMTTWYLKDGVRIDIPTSAFCLITVPS